MPASFGAANRCEAEALAATAAVTAAYDDETGVYLTDEIFLYRVAGLVVSEADEAVELEDCYLLDIVCVSAEDLRARGLRVVTSASDN